MKKLLGWFALLALPLAGGAETVYVGAFKGTELVMVNDASKSLTDPVWSFTTKTGSSQNLYVHPPYGWKVSYWVKARNDSWLRPDSFSSGFCEKIETASTNLLWQHSTTFTRVAAKLDPLEYDIAFQAGDSAATGSTAKMEGLSFTNNAVRLTDNGFALAGRAFRCWRETSPNSGFEFADRATVGGAALAVSNDQQTVTLTAQWTNCIYRVSFDTNGGGAAPAGIDVTYSETYPTLPEPTWSGYAFAGWYTERDGGNLVRAGDRVSVTAPTTLYAHWTVNSYKLTLCVEGQGTLVPPAGESNHSYGESVELAATPATGYLFAKWKEDGSVENPRTVTMTDAATWTAVFTAKVFAVTFKYRTTRAVTETQYVSYGESATAPSLSTVDKRPGYTFVGWNPSSYNPIYEDKIVTAQYDANIYYVCFQPNGDDVTGTMTDQEMECGTTEALNKNRFKRPGYAFVGWNTESDGFGDPYADQEPVCDLATDDGAEVLLYAQWEERQYKVSFDANGGDGTMAPQTVSCGVRTPLVANAFTRTGYTFAGWTTNGVTEVVFADGAEVLDLVDVDQTAQLKAVWTPNAYFVRFDANGGLGTMPNQAFTYDQPQALIPNAYEEASGIGLFAYGGWSNLVAGVSYTNCETVLNLCAEPNGTNVLTAIWLDNRTMESKALGCVNLQWSQSDQSGFTGLRGGEDIPWRQTTDGLAMDAYSVYALLTQVKGSGVLSFDCRKLGAEATEVRVNVTAGAELETSAFTAKENVNGTEWQTVRVPIKVSGAEETRNVFVYLYSVNGVELRQMTWEPARPRPLTLLLR